MCRLIYIMCINRMCITTFNTPERHRQECVMSQVGVMSLALRSGDVYTVVDKPVRVIE